MKYKYSLKQVIEKAKNKDPELLCPPYDRLIQGVRYYIPNAPESSITRLAREYRFKITDFEKKMKNSIVKFN